RHALFDSDRWRPVDHDGATRPFRSAVLLLPPGRPDPRNPPAAADRKTHQLCLCAGEVEAELQRNRPSVNRSRTAAAHPLDRVFVWHHQRTEAGGGTGHALGLALVHRTGLRSGDSASLHVLEKPAWTVSGIEVVRGTVRADRAAVCGS